MAEVITLQQGDIAYSYSEFLPDVVRVLEAAHDIDEKGRVRHIATVYGNSFEATLSWTNGCYDERITKGALARVYWPKCLGEVDGLYPVIRLVPIDKVDHRINLFDTVPPSWSRQRSLLNRAKDLWNQLPETRKDLFNELFWDVNRFHRYICIPASIDNHHSGWGGNLHHAVDMAEHAERIALDIEGVSGDLLILAGLLHNAPWVGAYTWKDGQWRVGGPTVLRTAEQAFQAALDAILTRQPRLLTHHERQSLWQMLRGSEKQHWEARRKPMVSLENEILQMADRLSCVLNLREQSEVQ